MLGILHLTDFHIKDPDGHSEHLRSDYFEEYLSGLIDAVKEAITPAAILVTGDFVHQGRMKNYVHAERVLKHLCESFSLTFENVAVCIGNHDIDKVSETQGHLDRAREQFTAFAEKFANGTKSSLTHAAGCLCAPAKGVSCLVIDSTRGGGTTEPGQLTDDEVDWLVSAGRTVPAAELLVVMSHYPVAIPSDSIADYLEGDPSYKQRHEFRQGKPVRRRLVAVRKAAKARLLWLSGDVHLPEQLEEEGGVFLVSTGRLQSLNDPPGTTGFVQARLIQIPEDLKAAPLLKTLTHEREGFNDNPHVGHWACHAGRMRKQGGSEFAERPEPATARLTDAQPERAPTQPVTTRPRVVSVSATLEARIVRDITENGLYSLGRFKTGGEQASLGWILINSLMALPGVLNGAIKSFADWLEAYRQQSGLTPGEVLLVGIDSWGAVLATQLAVPTGIRVLPVSARARNRQSRVPFPWQRALNSGGTQTRLVVFVCDVIATGSTLRWVYSDCSAWLTGKGIAPPAWIAMALVCDGEQSRQCGLSFLAAVATGCGLIRIPILSADALPSEEMFPPNVVVG